MEKILDLVSDFIGMAIATFVVIALFIIVKRVFERKVEGKKTESSLKQVILALIATIGTIVIVMTLPIKDELRGQILSLVGIVLSATIALSATTFVGNAFAGLMNKIVNPYQIGDYIQIKDHFGSVTDKGMFHTEIQVANRDLVTLPNLILATNPVKVMRSTGTLISTEVSLGYDVPRLKIEQSLKQAALDAELSDPFVFVTSLGDFSVVYKIHGMLNNIDLCLSASSKLNKMVLDNLHKDGIEIVSPTFMNQRQVGDTIFIPKKVRIKEEQEEASPESIIFDKAMKAETLVKKNERLEELAQRIEAMKAELKTASDDAHKASLEQKIAKWTETLEKTKEKLQKEKSDLDKEDNKIS